MVSIFIDTSLNDFFISFVLKSKTIYFDHKKEFIKKSDYLIESILKGIEKINLSINDIEKIFITIGPGSFMGIRASILFAKIFCLLKNKELYIITTLKLLAINLQENKVYLNAKNKKLFFYDLKKYSIIDEKGKKESKLNYSFLIKNPLEHFKHFKKVDILDDIKPFYMKEINIIKKWK